MNTKKRKDENRISLQELKAKIEHLVQAHHLNLCLECGKCSSVCVMLNLYGEYLYVRSPRGVVEQMSLDPENIEAEALWYCLACDECSFYCPSGVNFKDFMMALRELLIRFGYKDFAVFCSDCGEYLMPKKEFEFLVKDSDYIKTKDLLGVCQQCKQKRYTGTLRRMAPLVKS